MVLSSLFFFPTDSRIELLIMRNYQEDIPPWKKEVLMRGDGLSKAVENDSLASSEENVFTSDHQISGIKQPIRYRIGSSSSFMSKVKSFFVDGRDRDEKNMETMLEEKHKLGRLYL